MQGFSWTNHRGRVILFRIFSIGKLMIFLKCTILHLIRRKWLYVDMLNVFQRFRCRFLCVYTNCNFPRQFCFRDKVQFRCCFRIVFLNCFTQYLVRYKFARLLCSVDTRQLHMFNNIFIMFIRGEPLLPVWRAVIVLEIITYWTSSPWVIHYNSYDQNYN